MEVLKLEKHYTLEEYLDLERKSETKYEYHDGRIVAMAGGRPEHSQIAQNTSAALSIALGEKDCIIYGSDLKVKIEKSNRIVFPDLMVICNGLEMYKNTVDIITNPSLIIEVLSPSTERYDRTGKFKLYRQLPSFKEYVLISTDVPTVEIFYRERADYWHIETAIGLDSEIHLKSINCTIQLKDIYRKVKGLKDPQAFMNFE